MRSSGRRGTGSDSDKARRREVAGALRAGGKTQAETAAILGVGRKTVDDWESEPTKASDGGAAKASTPDRRLKLSKDDYKDIYARAQAGETQEENLRRRRRAWMRAIQGVTTRYHTSLPHFALDSPVALA